MWQANLFVLVFFEGAEWLVALPELLDGGIRTGGEEMVNLVSVAGHAPLPSALDDAFHGRDGFAHVRRQQDGSQVAAVSSGQEKGEHEPGHGHKPASAQ